MVLKAMIRSESIHHNPTWGTVVSIQATITQPNIQRTTIYFLIHTTSRMVNVTPKFESNIRIVRYDYSLPPPRPQKKARETQIHKGLDKWSGP